MHIYVFSSKSLANIWTACRTGIWAVTLNEKRRKELTSKSQNMQPGSRGIFYCEETSSLTMPFITITSSDPNRTISNLWDGEWMLPFQMRALGTPSQQLHKDIAKARLPVFQTSDRTNFGHVFKLQGLTMFGRTEIGADDWSILIANLAERKSIGQIINLAA